MFQFIVLFLQLIVPSIFWRFQAYRSFCISNNLNILMYKTYPFFCCLIWGQKSASYTRDGTVFTTEPKELGTPSCGAQLSNLDSHELDQSGFSGYDGRKRAAPDAPGTEPIRQQRRTVHVLRPDAPLIYATGASIPSFARPFNDCKTTTSGCANLALEKIRTQHTTEM